MKMITVMSKRMDSFTTCHLNAERILYMQSINASAYGDSTNDFLTRIVIMGSDEQIDLIVRESPREIMERIEACSEVYIPLQELNEISDGIFETFSDNVISTGVVPKDIYCIMPAPAVIDEESVDFEKNVIFSVLEADREKTWYRFRGTISEFTRLINS